MADVIAFPRKAKAAPGQSEAQNADRRLEAEIAAELADSSALLEAKLDKLRHLIGEIDRLAARLPLLAHLETAKRRLLRAREIAAGLGGLLHR